MKPKPKTENETEIRNRNPKLKPVSETEIEIENETEIKTETETEIPSGEELLDVERVKALIERIIDSAQGVGANLLETRQACKAVYMASGAKIASSMEEAARRRGEEGGHRGGA